MQRKALMGMAAVAGIALLLYIRRKGASDDAASTSGVLTSNAALINAAMGNVWGGSSAPASAPAPAAPVADARASSPAPAPASQEEGGGMRFAGIGTQGAGAPLPPGQYNYVSESWSGGYHSAPVVDDGRVAELDGVRNFVGGRDLFDSGVLGDIASAARGQGMGYWETMRTLGEAYSLTPNQVSQHMSQYGGVAQW